MNDVLEKKTYDEGLSKWVDKQKTALEFVNYVGKLMYGHSVELVLFRNHLVDCSISEVLDLHEYARKVVNNPIDVETSTSLAKEIFEMNLVPSKIDIGKLSSEWLNEKINFDSMKAFLDSKIGHIVSINNGSEIEPKDVILYGFGRIGRLAAREIIKQAGKGQQLRLKAIVVRSLDEKQVLKRASLFQNDSVHGPFKGNLEIDLENETLVINGQRVRLIGAKNPEDIDYTQYGISDALLIDNTGAFRDRTELSRHLESKGVSKVLLTAPGKEIPNIVYGVNHKDLDIENENIYCAASCTTNAIVPILKAVNDSLEIERGHIETVHAYTNDQNLLDNMHKKHRRGRSAAVNMVITETGAGKAVTKVIPELKDKLTANAVRVPTPNGSLAIMSLQVSNETSVEDVQEKIRTYALEGDLVNQIKYSINDELVSSDIVGETCCSIFDSPATLVHPDKKNIVLYVWYDNEYGYTKQVIRLAKYVSKVSRVIYY